MMPKRKAAQYVSIDQDGDAVGKMMLHLSAEKHATGEAFYLDDITSYESKSFSHSVNHSHSSFIFTQNTMHVYIDR
jgi:xanthine dehydrogenase molybdopterin-binding subunit B